MSTVTVSIGRGSGTGPLSDDDWSIFRALTESTLRDYCDTLYVTDAVCVGSWDGVEEESRTWVARWDYEEAPSALVGTLALLARHYGQDAIAVTTGTTILAGL